MHAPWVCWRPTAEMQAGLWAEGLQRAIVAQEDSVTSTLSPDAERGR